MFQEVKLELGVTVTKAKHHMSGNNIVLSKKSYHKKVWRFLSF